jgi:hypothetical protein
VTFQDDDLRMKRIPNSVDTMSPKNRFVKAINTLPITPGIPHHVICGDRGKGGNRDQTKPVMSDGFVPYWSSHMDAAQSELIVPSNHSAHQNRQAIAEVERILKTTNVHCELIPVFGSKVGEPQKGSLDVVRRVSLTDPPRLG